MTQDRLREAQAAFAEGDLSRALEFATQGLEVTPDDVELLGVAARAALDADPGQAARHLRRLVAIVPDDADAWHDMGSALVDDGQLAEAAEALRAAVRLRPDDVGALVDLAHVVFATGQAAEALELLSQARERDPHDPGILRSMVEMHRVGGRAQAALECALLLAEEQPDDVLALLDIADQQLFMGDVDDAIETFDRLRRVDPDEGHEVYAYHGMIEAHLRRGRWRQALDVAIEATRVDRHQVTTDVLAFVAAELFGENETLRRAPDATPPPSPALSRADVERLLSEERADHRRLHAEAMVA